MTPSRILLCKYALEAMLQSAPSATGKQIEALQNNIQPNKHGWRGDALERKRQQYADLVLLTKDLNPDEARVCRLRYGTSAGVECYERIVSTHELEDAEQWQGETMLPGRMGAVADNPDLRKVVGVRARLPSFDEIAGALCETSAWQVKRLLESARAKVAWQIKVRDFQGAIEAGYAD